MTAPILALSGWLFYGGLATADMASTHYALSAPGTMEGNALMRGPRAYAIKAASVTVLTLADKKLGKRRWILRAAVLAWNGWVVQHNVRMGLEARK